MLTKNLTVEIGSDYSISMRLKQGDGSLVDTTRYSVVMHVREEPYSKKVDCLSTTNGRITNPSKGEFVLHFPHEVTEELPEGTYQYDIRFSNSEEYKFLLGGSITFKKMITR